MNMSLILLLVLVASFPKSALADAKAGEKKAQLCLLCHKVNFSAAYVPTLEGQNREYLYNQLKAYKEKRRADPTMQTNVSGLNDRDLREIANYFASRPPIRATFSLDADKIARGRAKAEEFGCATCHRPDYSGAKDIPRLAGMEPRYLSSQLVTFSTGGRAHPAISRSHPIAEADAENLSQHFAHLQ